MYIVLLINVFDVSHAFLNALSKSENCEEIILFNYDFNTSCFLP